MDNDGKGPVLGCWPVIRRYLIINVETCRFYQI